MRVCPLKNLSKTKDAHSELRHSASVSGHHTSLPAVSQVAVGFGAPPAGPAGVFSEQKTFKLKHNTMTNTKACALPVKSLDATPEANF